MCKEISAKNSDPEDPQHFGFPDPNPLKFTNPRIQIQRVKYYLKTVKKTLAFGS